MNETNSHLVQQAVRCWRTAQVIHLSPSFNGIPEASAWVEKLSNCDAEEYLLDNLKTENQVAIAYVLLTLERMKSPRLKEVIEDYCGRRKKITLLEGSFSTSMDLGGLARRIRKKLNA
jgi:hypothetical protein